MSKITNVKTLATAGMLLALAVIFGFLKVPITDTLEIRFLTLPIAMAGILLGPVYGILVGALTDIVSYIVMPTGAFFPGFTISYALTGLIYAIVAHVDSKGKISLVRILIAQLICSFFIDVLLNSLWLSILYGIPFMVVLVPRIPKEIIMYPIYSLLLFFILRQIKNSAASLLPTRN